MLPPCYQFYIFTFWCLFLISLYAARPLPEFANLVACSNNLYQMNAHVIASFYRDAPCTLFSITFPCTQLPTFLHLPDIFSNFWADLSIFVLELVRMGEISSFIQLGAHTIDCNLTESFSALSTLIFLRYLAILLAEQLNRILTKMGVSISLMYFDHSVHIYRKNAEPKLWCTRSAKFR